MGTTITSKRFVSAKLARYGIALLAATSLLECGNVTGFPGIPAIAPGIGNGVLLVNVQIETIAVNSNGLMATDFETSISVRVTRGNAPVTNARVVVSSMLGGPVAMIRGAGGTYGATQAGYFRDYTVDVTADTDSVTSIKGTGPDIWRFASPDTGARVPEGRPLNVRWYGMGAPITSVDTLNVDSMSIADTGAFTVPAAAILRRDGMDTMDKIRVRRGNEQQIMGAAPGSSFLTAVRNILTFTVVAP